MTEVTSYLDWVESVARACARSSAPYLLARELTESMASAWGAPGADQDVVAAVWTALEDLASLGVVRLRGTSIEPTQFTRQMRHEGAMVRDHWQDLTETYLDPEQHAFLAALIAASERVRPGSADLEMVSSADVFEALGWSEDDHDATALVAGLAGLGYVRYLAETGPFVLVRPTYAAIVRVTQREASEWQARAAAMLNEGETTTVEYKRELRLDTVREKAEFIKDVLGLATTKASGRDRHMLIGIDDRTRQRVSDLDAGLRRERLEQILNAYSEPSPDVDWVTLPFAGGTIGVVVVRRDPLKVPYRVSKPIGKLEAGDVFVRHGSHTEAPTEAEMTALIAEGEHARERAAE
jgi:hypothetical protein